MAAFWEIVGYQSLQPFYRREIPFGFLSEKEIERLLQRLVAQHITADEIVDASLRRNTKGYKPLLEVTRNHGGRYALSVGNNPFFTAKVRRD